MSDILYNWRQRHQHPVSFWLHMVGIPLAVAGLILGAVQITGAVWDASLWGLWWRPIGLIVLGYVLQWIGHAVEGNDLGELILIKKWLGRPYVEISPRYARRVGARGDKSANG